MSPRPLPAEGRAAVEDELLARLGLPSSASPEDVDELHAAVSEFLASAPSHLRGWAHAQVAALDAAYLQLTDPVGLEGSALRSPTRPPTVVPGGPATPPARRDSAPAAIPASSAADLDDEDDDEDEAIDAAVADLRLDADGEPDAETLAALYAAVTPSAHADMAPGARAARPTKKERREARRAAAAVIAPAAAASSAQPNVWKRLVLGTVAVAAVIAVAFGVNQLVNGSSGAPIGDGAQASQPAASGPALDQAKVSELMGKYQANPKDVDTLLALANEFYSVGMYEEAGPWLDKVIEVDPKNERARLARGAVYFNIGDLANAEKTWLAFAEEFPKNAEVHYDLGFLYLNQTNPDWEAVKREWNKVVELDPNGSLAQTVKAHLDSLNSSSMIPSADPGASAGASAAPSSAPSAAPSSAPSAAPSAPTGNVLNLTALNLAFGTSQLAAPADTPFTIHFDNQENGLPHDVQIKDATGTVVFAGVMVTGPTTADYNIPALKAGAYTFLCSIHPNMTGTLQVGS